MHDACAEEEIRERVETNIQSWGWNIICHNPEDQPAEKSVPYCYSIGFSRSFDHPEILIAGLDLSLAQRFLGILKTKIEEGFRAETNRVYSNFLGPSYCPILFLPIPESTIRDQLSWMSWFYDSHGHAHSAFQVVWPDRQGYFPWVPGAFEGAGIKPPVFGYIPEELK